MKKQILTLGLFLSMLVLSAQTPCANDTNIYQFTFGGKNYEIVMEKKNWADAASCAVERGGYLAEINSLEEQNAVYDAVINGAKVSPTYVVIANGGGIAYVWIGANDIAAEGTWVWNGDNEGSGTPFWTGQGAAGTGGGNAVGGAYVNWGGKSSGSIKEPDNFNGDQDCGAIALAGWPSGTTMLGVAGEWNDIICSSEIYFVIEYPGSSSMEYEKQDIIKIYPNPATDKIFIKGDLDAAEIVDITGKQLIISSDNRHLDISELASGIYFIKLFTGDQIYIKKIIKR